MFGCRVVAQYVPHRSHFLEIICRNMENGIHLSFL